MAELAEAPMPPMALRVPSERQVAHRSVDLLFDAAEESGRAVEMSDTKGGTLMSGEKRQRLVPNGERILRLRIGPLVTGEANG